MNASNVSGVSPAPEPSSTWPSTRWPELLYSCISMCGHFASYCLLSTWPSSRYTSEVLFCGPDLFHLPYMQVPKPGGSLQSLSLALSLVNLSCLISGQGSSVGPLPGFDLLLQLQGLLLRAFPFSPASVFLCLQYSSMTST